MLSYPTSTLSQLGQPVWYRYNSQSGWSVPHEYNNISARLGWPVWIGFLSTWVVRMVRVNSTERCLVCIWECMKALIVGMTQMWLACIFLAFNRVLYRNICCIHVGYIPTATKQI